MRVRPRDEYPSRISCQLIYRLFFKAYNENIKLNFNSSCIVFKFIYFFKKWTKLKKIMNIHN